MFRPPVVVPRPPIIGLIIPNKNEEVPLKNVTVKAKLTGYVVAVSSVLRYINEGSDPLEVLFRFPVDESFAVVGLVAVIAGRRIKAEIKEKEEARQEYDDAMASGITAALGEETTGDIFSISLGNLPPKADAEIHLQLVGELPLDAEGGVHFSLPAVLKPRYTPAGSIDPLRPVNQQPNPFAPNTTQGRAPAVFDFSLDIVNPSSVSEVTSPTHSVTTQRDPHKITVSLGEPKPLDKDLVISVVHNDPHTPLAIAEPGNPTLSQRKYMGSPAVMLNFFPKFETKRAACEFIFVIDRSGSMSGGYMSSAKETLLLFLKSIPPGCYFNIIGFGSRYEVLFSSSEEYNQANLDRAIHHTENIYANLGGTELLAPLKHIYSQPLLPGLPRQVFVLTDGSVSNSNTCIQEVGKNVKHTRVFTFGIGSGASTELVRGLARAGNGTAEFVQEGERMQPKVIASLKRALQPAVTDLEVSFEVPSGFDALRAPSKIPILYNGDKTTIYGIFKSKALSDDPLQTSLVGTATLKGKILGKSIEYAIPFEAPEPSLWSTESETPVVHQLASKSLIRDWQDEHGSKKAIIDLSIESSVISAHTAYVAIDEEYQMPIDGAVKVWDIVASMAAREEGRNLFGGGGGVFGGSLGGAMYFQSSNSSFGSAGGPAPIPGGMMGSAPPSALFFRGPASGNLSGGPPLLMSQSLGASAPAMAAHSPSSPFYSPTSPSYSPASSHDGGLFQSVGPPPQLRSGGLFSPMSAGGPPPPPPTSGLASRMEQPTSDLLFGGPPPPPAPLFGGPPVADNFSSEGQSLFSQRKQSAPSGLLTKIISLQQAQGFWQLEQVASQIFQKPVSQLATFCPTNCHNNVWATILVLVYLESKFASQKDEWELVAMKAEMWIEDQSIEATAFIELKEAAKKCIT